MQAPHLKLSDQERSELKHLLSKGTLNARVFKRATALLELDRGKSMASVAQTMDVSYPAVVQWRDKYRQEKLAMLYDKPRSGRPPEIDGVLRAKITALACSEPPKGHSRWSLRLLADKVVELGYCSYLSHDSARRILKKTNSNLT